MIRKGGTPVEGKRKRGAGRAAPAALAACLCALAVALLAWGPWAQPAPGGGGELDVGQAAVADGEGPDGPPADEGPGGEGVLDPNDFEDDAAYERALIESGSPRVEVPRERVDTSGDGSYGYVKGILEISFDAECGESRARSIVEGAGGVWVSDTFAWPSSAARGKASVEAYFPGCVGEEELRAVAEELEAMPEVEYASLDTWFANLAADGDGSVRVPEAASLVGYAVNDPEAPCSTGSPNRGSGGRGRSWDGVREGGGCVRGIGDAVSVPRRSGLLALVRHASKGGFCPIARLSGGAQGDRFFCAGKVEQFLLGMDVAFRVDAAHVGVHGVERYEQFVANVRAVAAFEEERKHLAFPFRKVVALGEHFRLTQSSGGNEVSFVGNGSSLGIVGKRLIGYAARSSVIVSVRHG